MKKVFLFILMCVSFACVYAQETNDNTASEKMLNLSAAQITRIKKLNREVGPKFEAIGRDISLSGYEKGQKKKLLALQHKKEIMEILTPEQRQIWEDRYGKISQDEGIRNIIQGEYNNRAKELDDKYESEKKVVEKNMKLSKDEKKDQLKALKYKYKEEKEHLKEECNVAINTGLLSR